MRLHPRARVMSTAENEIRAALTDAEARYELTYGEIFGILADLMASSARYLRRDERHPDDPDKGGDEA